MPIDVYESTDFETLWSKFQSVIARPQSSVLAKETIVVPGKGWSSVLSRRLASQTGCWAQFEFLPLGIWIAVVLEKVLGQELAPERELDSLTWAIARRLRDFISDPDFGDVRNYLFAHGGKLDVQNLLDLSRCIGRLFDRYLLDRPELIDGWQAGRDWPERAGEVPTAARWQRKLWQKITEDVPYRSVKAMTADVADKLSLDPTQISERVNVWVAGGLAQSHLDFFEAVGRFSNINVFILVPALEYWGDMQGRRTMLRKLRTAEISLRQFCVTEHVDLLHPLLASCGELSRQQQMLMVDRDGPPWHYWELTSEEEQPFDVTSASLLNCLQRSVRRAIDPLSRELHTDEDMPEILKEPFEPYDIARLPNDSSLRIHSCHTPLREVEVLRDQLLAAFDADDQLRPEDVVVMSPDLETYAPFIQAVFGADGFTDNLQIPFQIAGRSNRKTRPAIEAYFRVLAVLQGRFAISEMVDLLHIEVIGKAAKLNSTSIDDVAQWAIQSGVRWGVDAEHRETEELPATDLNTWEFGLDRLLLGYAMPPGGEMLVDDVAALDRASGLEGATLGLFWAFIRRLTNWRDRIQKSHSVADWQPLLTRLVQEFVETDDDPVGVQILFDAIDHVAKLAVRNDFDHQLPFRVITLEIEREVDEQTGAGGFRIGGVTFCDLASVRSLPFAVVGLLGLNDGAFPRSERPVRFDLIARSPQLGDRAPRHEDRHLFLEAILAAKSQLIITYQGQGIRDQKPRPPSVLVDELLDVLKQETNQSGTDSNLRDALVIEHPLQAFSPRYFDESHPQLFSYQSSLCRAAAGILKPRELPAPFSQTALEVAEAENEVSTDELRLALISPWKLFLQRLNLSLRDDAVQLEDREPLLLQGLDRWSIGDHWLTQRLKGASTESIIRHLERSGMLPAGALGQAEAERINNGIEWVIAESKKSGVDPAANPLLVRIDLAGRTLTGHVKDWTTQGIRRATWSSLSTKKLLELWYDQLLSAVTLNREVAPAVLITRDQAISIGSPSVDVAYAELSRLMEVYELAQRLPLPFFSECINTKKLCQRKLAFDDAGVQEILKHARTQFATSYQAGALPSLADDPAIRQAFAGLSPLNLTCAELPELAGDDALQFIVLAQRIAEPLMRCLEITQTADGNSGVDTN